MARREVLVEELVEVIYQWHQGSCISQIKRSLGLDRKTIRKYIALAEGEGFRRDMELKPYTWYLELANRIQMGLKTPLEHSPAYKKTSLYQSTIERLLSMPYMKPKQVYRILKRDYKYDLSYASFNRYMNLKYPKQPRSCIRIETRAGEEAQVDFGSAGMMYDPKEGRLRRAHIFVMVLSYSRLPYVEFVFDQGQVTWVQCHINAFEFFGGVPKRIILDNLRSGILRPNTYDPVFNRAYAECAKHYGFIIDPAKIRTAEHKGKVERRIPVIRQQFLSTHAFTDIRDANEKVRQWCLYEYGMEIHGTTKERPFELFKQEKGHLTALPGERFDMPLWKEAKVHPDHHIVFDKSYYSVPTRYIGKKVWVRGGMRTVVIFYEGELIKTHQRAYRAGSWVTDEGDYPPEESRYIMRSVSHYEAEAIKHGEYVRKAVREIMSEHAWRNIRKIQAIFRLTEKYGEEAVNLTCKRCLYYEDLKISTIKRILKKNLYHMPLEEDSLITKALESSFIRQPEYFRHTTKEAR
ncbi:MAG: IS21 family transposase [Thermodesulfovibrionales bacterium]